MISSQLLELHQPLGAVTRPMGLILVKRTTTFFAPGLVSAFDLGRAASPARISVEKSASVPAPPRPLPPRPRSSDAADKDAVPWLYLVDAKSDNIFTSADLKGESVHGDPRQTGIGDLQEAGGICKRVRQGRVLNSWPGTEKSDFPGEYSCPCQKQQLITYNKKGS